MPGVAQFPWYDWPEVHDANAALFAAVRERMPTTLQPHFSSALDRTRAPADVWRDEGCVLSQACNVNVATDFASTVVPLAAPVFAREQLALELDRPPLMFAPGQYQSGIVVHREQRWTSVCELKGSRLVANARNSYSGFWSLQRKLWRENPSRPRVDAFFSAVEVSGSHRRSAAAVAGQAADCAAIDVVCLGLLRRHSPEIFNALKIIAWTEPALAPPFVASSKRPASERSESARALTAAVTSEEMAPARAALFLDGCRLVAKEEISAVAKLVGEEPS